jgi:hypothetical protein
MIQTLVGEAGAQSGPGDDTMSAILQVAKNRFGDRSFPGGQTSMWQDVLVASQFYGAADKTPNGMQPELDDSSSVFSGSSTVNVLNCEAYWSPTNQQFKTLQSWANTAANKVADNTWPASVGAPKLWNGTPKQAVIKGSIAKNRRSGYDSAPAVVLFRQAPSPTAPAVISIP